MSAEPKLKLYKEKLQAYFQNARRELVDLFPLGTERVLEIGCGNGATGHLAKSLGRSQFYAGVEISCSAAADAQRVLDAVHVGDIESYITQLPYPESYFDLLLFGDVLEYLIDPWGVLKDLCFYLKCGGTVIASIPNVRHVKVLLPLLFQGKFEYQEEGILDRGHLRFFTKRSIYQLLGSSGAPGGIDALSYGPSSQNAQRPKFRHLQRCFC
ncbi:class I SAM-dependent methyltransferase [Candidatus Desulforudis audaxviator]|uniref:Methyltransferase type 11 n=1 Tax=Desulforudis audaxviator (strain MP104C) TaxID=477974 RepID=B1I6U9_DESAP|nr:class I SAM-dependent methyltransferase [Candidatus Desulforudis audaxviator]ACA60194.1 Methyltransferase type 11 [Candidatus Desulforudis audaxviator MP104C]AZK60233.1 Methyltransferase type 11 [Candidatus Desulforudis audaxviator]